MVDKIVSLKQKYTIYLSAIIEVSFDSEPNLKYMEAN